MTRAVPMAAMALMIAGLLAVDHGGSAQPNPFRAPPLLALGSGLAAGGAHCAALPGG